MFQRGISPATKNSLAVLGRSPLLKHFYLAGGTACALRLGHRLSFDLDFFTKKKFNQQKLAQWMDTAGDWNLDRIKKNTLLGVFNQTKVSFFTYDYPLVAKTDLFENVSVLRPPDLMAMKIDAIATRGIKRDFIDLYFLCRKSSLAKAFSYYRQKYEQYGANLVHALRALTYFHEAEDKDSHNKLEMKADYNWIVIKKYFFQSVPKITTHLLTEE